MIPNLKHRDLSSQGVASSSEFGISQKDSAHIMTILRDTLYSDKILAVLREYSSNAWDAHREAGKGDLPIKITLPSFMTPTLLIRDYGPGLSTADVFNLYTQYGASTKRDNSEAIGMMGIGCKAAFAYSDTFTVTSWHGGAKKVYVAVLDKTDKGVINLMHQEPCGDETGVEIQIAVKQSDIEEFKTTARKLFMYFTPRPDINVDLPELDSEATLLPSGRVSHSARGWKALMGCIPYSVDLEQIRRFDGGIPGCLHSMGGEVYFKIGEVHISASREGLKYSDLTKAVLKKKLNQLIDEYIQKELDGIDSLSEWDRRWRCYRLQQLSLPLPPQYREEVSCHISLQVQPHGFFFTQGYKRKIARSLSLYQDARIVVRDETKAVNGYSLSIKDYVVRRDGKTDWKEVWEGLEKFIKANKLTGIPVIKISSLPWRPTGRTPSVPTDHTKYKYATFKFLPKARPARSPSAQWEAVTRTPTADDVWVILEGFRVTEHFAGHYQSDRQLAENCKQTMPEVYGYRTTKAKPVDKSKLLGLSYDAWREEFRKKMAALPEVLERFAIIHWTQLFHTLSYSDHRRRTDTLLPKATEELGEKHPLRVFLSNGQAGMKMMNSSSADPYRNAARILNDEGIKIPDVAQQAVEELYKQYPLLRTQPQLVDALAGEHAALWFGYIRNIDKECL